MSSPCLDESGSEGFPLCKSFGGFGAIGLPSGECTNPGRRRSHAQPITSQPRTHVLRQGPLEASNYSSAEFERLSTLTFPSRKLSFSQFLFQICRERPAGAVLLLLLLLLRDIMSLRAKPYQRGSWFNAGPRAHVRQGVINSARRSARQDSERPYLHESGSNSIMEGHCARKRASAPLLAPYSVIRIISGGLL